MYRIQDSPPTRTFLNPHDPTRLVKVFEGDDFNLRMDAQDYNLVRILADGVDLSEFEPGMEYNEWTVPKLVSKMVKIDTVDPNFFVCGLTIKNIITWCKNNREVFRHKIRSSAGFQHLTSLTIEDSNGVKLLEGFEG
ncbi:MAG: hypothetical protein SGARI_007166, partial [Bacillariaceae sp.]